MQYPQSLWFTQIKANIAPEKYFSFYSYTYLLISALVSEACPIWAGLRQRCAPPWCNLAGRRMEGSVTARKTAATVVQQEGNLADNQS
ncbi:hypothetical protein [Aeromonas caviae]